MMADADDAALQHTARDGREFSLEEAIARLAGPGGLKGASPLMGRRAAEAAIELAVRRDLSDPGGALATVLIRAVVTSDVLAADPHRPDVALAVVLDRHLASSELLGDLVRDADQEWGQVMGERPYFERAGEPADPADPYTRTSVRQAVQQLRARVATT